MKAVEDCTDRLILQTHYDIDVADEIKVFLKQMFHLAIDSCWSNVVCYSGMDIIRNKLNAIACNSMFSSAFSHKFKRNVEMISSSDSLYINYEQCNSSKSTCLSDAAFFLSRTASQYPLIWKEHCNLFFELFSVSADGTIICPTYCPGIMTYSLGKRSGTILESSIDKLNATWITKINSDKLLVDGSYSHSSILPLVDVLVSSMNNIEDCKDPIAYIYRDRGIYQKCKLVKDTVSTSASYSDIKSTTDSKIEIKVGGNSGKCILKSFNSFTEMYSYFNQYVLCDSMLFKSFFHKPDNDEIVNR